MQPSTSSQQAAAMTTPPTLRVYFHNHGQQSMPVADLVFLQSDANYTWLNWTNGKRVLVPRTLKYLEDRLPQTGFIRLHRNYAVNVSHITAVSRTRKGVEVRLSNGQCLLVARRRWVEIRHHFAADNPTILVD